MPYTRHIIKTEIDHTTRKRDKMVKQSGLMVFIAVSLVCGVIILCGYIIFKAAGL